jgi:gluconolactonase
MSVKIVSEKLGALIDAEAKVERLATGFLFTEGPLWDHARRTLYFSDMPGNVLRSWSEADGIREVRRPSDMSNGLTFDQEGRLIACEHATRRVTREERDGTRSVIAQSFGGTPLNSPNDVVAKSDGSIYFSDPNYGLKEYYGIPRPQDLAFQGVYRVSPKGGLELLAKDFAEPNGLCFSPDESLLYINDTERMHIRVFDIVGEGRLAQGRIFFEESGAGGAPDGMKVDERGNVYCTGPEGIWIISPGGEHLGVIRVPERTANMNWGDDDWKTLYITATSSIYRVRLKVAGNRVPYMRSAGA